MLPRKKKNNKPFVEIDLFKAVLLKLNLKSSYRAECNKFIASSSISKTTAPKVKTLTTPTVYGVNSFRNFKINIDKNLSQMSNYPIENFIKDSFSLVGFIDLAPQHIKTNKYFPANFIKESLLNEVIFIISNFNQIIDLGQSLTVSIDKFTDGVSIIFSINTERMITKKKEVFISAVSKELKNVNHFYQIESSSDIIFISTYFSSNERVLSEQQCPVL